MNCDNKICGCIGEILNKILLLQKNNSYDDCFVGCDKPFLGPSPSVFTYNTRPITLFNRYTGEPWSFTYTSGTTTAVSSILRVECLDDCCCTCRILGSGEVEGTYTNTGEFVTIDLNSVGAIRCFADTFVDGIA